MGCDIKRHTQSSVCNSFNPRTHMGCDQVMPCDDMPTKEFQSTHPHGVRLLKSPRNVPRKSFNPRTHMGCDSWFFTTWSDASEVSIHAPTWGATEDDYRGYAMILFQSTHPHGVRPNGKSIMRCVNGFNPRTHMGCDVIFFFHLTFDDLFQSTHPHGVRPASPGGYPGHLLVSIHAPTWGAT